MLGPTQSAGRALALSICALLPVACDNVRSPSSPSSVTPTDTSGYHLSFTVSGTAFEHLPSGVRPLPGLRILARRSSQPSGYGADEVTSDGSGHYQFSAEADVGSFVALELPVGAGSHAPCPSGVVQLVEDTALDVHVVSDAVLKATGAPESLPTWRPRVSGTVQATRYAWWDLLDERPIVGASVELSSQPDDVVRSATLTDANGEYLLCASFPGMGTNQPAHITVRKDGLELASKSFTAYGDTLVSFEVERD